MNQLQMTVDKKYTYYSLVILTKELDIMIYYI